MPRRLIAGLHESLITEPLREALAGADPARLHVERDALDPAEAPAALARHVHDALLGTLEALPGDSAQRLALVNRVLAALRAEALAPDALGRAEQLLAIVERSAQAPAAAPPPRPGVALASSALLVNAAGEHRIGHEISREIASSEQVDLLCSFVKWSGLRLLREALLDLLRRGGRLRVLTTVYMGATERGALDALHALGAEVRVSYDTRRTRLHAKAWLFRRNSGFDTAYVGSSNLSAAAMVDGIEWNVRLSRVDAGPLLDKFAGTFEAYWNDPGFERYDPARDAGHFDRARAAASGESEESVLSGIQVRPWPHQEEILDRLEAERRLHGRRRNLVVAATGTGKTIVAALDYRRLRATLGRGRLLFVAHREEILQQSRQAFREVLGEGGFGELWVGGRRPERGEQVFASIQSLAQVDLAQLAPTSFEMLIVDEFHHAAATTYERLLAHLRPDILLGLTATPERGDGQSVLGWFDGRIAAELRLWSALERGLLSPFHYFGVHDPTGLEAVAWSRGQYDRAQLEGLYTGNDARVRLILRELGDKVLHPGRMRALGFCVGVGHARFMAEQFNRAGLPSAAVTGETPEAERRAAREGLRQGRLRCVFSVDVFNEGVDLPEVDTLLFLRPTESATVFLQQLGRGLRLAPGKECLTVLDFIGGANRRFRFDRRFRALGAPQGAGVLAAVQEGFPVLPAGSAMSLDRAAQEIVVRNIREHLRSAFATLVAEAREAGPDLDLGRFLERVDLEPRELYRRPGETWTRIRREAGFPCPDPGPDEAVLLRSLRGLLHVDDELRLGAWRRALRSGEVEPRAERLLWMLHFALWGRARAGVPATPAATLARLARNPALRDELGQLLDLLDDRRATLVRPFSERPEVPLCVHASYSLVEILAAFGETDCGRLAAMRQGVLWREDSRADLFFITLQKADRDYSPTTMYRDYAISQDRFHWESQSTTGEDSPTGRRYRGATGLKLLFVRRLKRDERGVTAPYIFLGPASYLSHQGERPMAITWKLAHPMPGALLEETRLAAG